MNCPRLLVIPLLLALPGSLLAERTVEFSGYEWDVRRATEPEGPGPNVFLDSRRTVFLDEDGNLHLRIWSRGSEWYAAEVRLNESMGYGSYTFQTSGDLVFESPGVILGLFVYDHNAPQAYYREIDIEFGRFGDPHAPHGQFAVQPFERRGNKHGFMLPPAADVPMTHGFLWEEGLLRFRSARGDHSDLFDLADDHPQMISTMAVTGASVPEPGDETVHINFWLYEGRTPETEHEVIVRSFSYREPARR